MSSSIKKIIIGFAGATILATAANAGGFSRGTADTDILFEDGNFNMRSGITYVSPQRRFETVFGADSALTPYGDGVYSNAYGIFSGAVAAKLHNSLTCAGTFAQVYGGSSSYEAFLPTSTALGNRGQKFTINEIGGTCRFSADVRIGELSVIGGVFQEQLDFEQIVTPGALPLDPSDDGVLKVTGDAIGYRVGLAFEKPEIALRAQLLYRSETKHTPDGTTTGLAAIPLPTVASATLPQSVELKVQSGVAPGWLVFGNVKWTDWSVIDVLSVSINGGASQDLEYFWRDGWTISGGVGHAFNDKLSGAVSLTWDKGVSTGLDTYTDTWTVGVGGAYKFNDNAELRLGGGVSLLTAGSQAVASGAAYDATVGNDMAYAITSSFKVKF